MNAKAKKPRHKLGLCPKCGMDSGTRKVSETVPERCYIVCETCGFRVGPFSDLSHATWEWEHHGRNVSGN